MKYIELHIEKPLSRNSRFVELELPVRVWSKNLYLEYGDRVPCYQTEEATAFEEPREFVIFGKEKKTIRKTINHLMEKQDEKTN